MVERYDGEQLPPAHPVQHGAPPVPDGDRVIAPPAPPPPVDLRRARLLAVLAAAVILAGIIIGAIQ